MDLTFTSAALDGDQLADALQADGFEVGPPIELTHTALDTFDARLLERGLRLTALDAPSQQLVLHGASEPVAARLTVTSAPRFAELLPAGPFRQRVLEITEERALLPLVSMQTRTRNAERRDRRAKVTVNMVIHDVLAVDGGGVPVDTPPLVVEIQPSPGHDDAAREAGEALRRAGLVPSSGDLFEQLAHDAGVALAGHQTSPTVPLLAEEPAFDGYRRVLVNLVATVVLNQPGTVEDVDPEFLHELRVAVRRTRSILSQSRGVLPDDVRDAQREAFGWLGLATGPARDLDVYILEWPTYVAGLPEDADNALRPIHDAIERRRRSAHTKLATALTSERYSQLISGWTDWLAEPTPGGPAAADPLGGIIAGRIRKAQRGVLRDGRAIGPDSPAERLHDLRKDAKRLRYLLECFGSLFAPKPRKAFVQRLKALQDNLGEHQDAEVHADQLRDIARQLHGRKRSVPADTMLAMGRLTEHLEQRSAAARAEFHKRFSDYDAKATAAALDALLDSLER